MRRDWLAQFGVNGYREGDVPPEEWIQIHFSDGGMGDHVCRLPAIKYLVEEYPFLNITVWCPTFFVEFAKKAVPSVNWKSYDELTEKVRASQQIISAGSNGGVTAIRNHLVDHAFMKIVDSQVSIEKKNYPRIKHNDVNLSKYNLPEKYVVITTGYTAKVREFNTKVVNDLIKYVKDKGYEVVFLGSNAAPVSDEYPPIKGTFPDKIKYHEGLDLIDQTSLVEAHAIIANSKCIIGQDNGLLHVAGCTDIPIVAGFTTVKPETRVPYRNNELGWNTYTVVPSKSLACRFCQSNMNFVYGADFRTCRYRDYKCVKDAQAQPFIDHLEKIL